ncbi:unnamed protein product [Allacma fusca]|uniref:Uncharacterized protein n=1 Tax=Allacma fusca TaxID=39272 RepID=A0A8J2KFE4_9HEXA|nr:unnamed protein product [Allacma fusca]
MKIPVFFLVNVAVTGLTLLCSVSGQEGAGGQETEQEEEQYLRGDPEDLTPLHPSHYFATPYRPKAGPPPPPPKVWKPRQPEKGETGDLTVAATDLAAAAGRQRPRYQSYNRNYNPKPKHYSTSNRHSDGKKTKGGYKNSDSYQGSQGYSNYGSYDRANKGDYGDSDHQEFNHKDGGRSSGGGGGKVRYGNYGGEYGDDGNAYTSPGGDYKKK